MWVSLFRFLPKLIFFFQLNSETSLYEQGIYHGSILDLNIKLDGGRKSGNYAKSV